MKNLTYPKSAAYLRLLAGFALAGVLLVAPRAYSANSETPVDTKEKDLAAAKKYYDAVAKKNNVKVDEAKKNAFADCYYTCRNGDKAKGADACGKQCGPELFPAGSK